MKRAIIFNATPFIYGAERGLMNLVKALRGRFDTIVVLPGRGALEDELRRINPDIDIRIFPLPVLTHSSSVCYYITFIPRLLASIAYFAFFIKYKKIDIVCTNSIVLISPAIAASIAGKRHIWYVREFFGHGALNYILGRVINIFSDTVICQSATIRRNLFLKNSDIIYEPLDECNYKIYEPDDAKDQMLIPRDATVISIISRLHPQKGQFEFLEEMKKSLKKFKNLVLVMAGDVSPRSMRNRLYKRNIERLIKKENLSNVRLLGFRMDIDKILSLSDICVFPFKREEPFGIAVAEALAFGRVTFFPRRGGLEEVYNIFKRGEEFSIEKITETAGDPEKIKPATPERLYIPEPLSFQTYKEKVLPIFEDRDGAS